MSDEYRTITSIYRGRTDRVIFVDRYRAPGECPVPRSLLHGADDLRVGRLVPGEAFTFRLRAWKA